jgi:hypothetical protein
VLSRVVFYVLAVMSGVVALASVHALVMPLPWLAWILLLPIVTAAAAWSGKTQALKVERAPGRNSAELFAFSCTATLSCALIGWTLSENASANDLIASLLAVGLVAVLHHFWVRWVFLRVGKRVARQIRRD